MTVKSRLPKILQSKYQTILCGQHKPYRATWGVSSVNDPAVNYQISVEWIADSWIEDIKFKQVQCTCRKVTGCGNGMADCQGNGSTVCYHSLGAVMQAADKKGKVVSLFDSFYDAVAHSRFGNQLVKIVNRKNGYCWATIGKKGSKERLAKNTNLLRGREEEGKRKG